jgi:ankyrin repeat protein
VNAKTENGLTALMLAVGAEQANAGSGRLDIVNALIKAGADVNAKAENGETALMSAREYLKQDIVNVLKAAGAK